MNKIHPSANIGSNVEMGENNNIGANVFIEEGVKIGDGNVFYPNAYIAQGTTIGNRNEFHMGCVIGHIPQDFSFKPEYKTYTQIGDDNKFREYVTIHRGTSPESSTIVGNKNFLMANAHLAHNCKVGNQVTLVNLASLAGYCEIEDQVFISGMVGVHQFCRIGRLSILSALSAVNKDVPPFTLCGGRPARAGGINIVGLRRAGMNPDQRRDIQNAFKLLYRSGLGYQKACDKIEAELTSDEVRHFVNFVRLSKRGICSNRDGGMEMKGVQI